MDTIIEYVVSVNGECHSVHSTLKEARNIYRSIINVKEVEGVEGKVEVISKTTKFKTLNEHEFSSEFFDAESFGESVNL